MKRLLELWDTIGMAALLAAFAAGLYVTVFYVTNNLTMLQRDAVFVLFGLLTALIVVPVAVIHHLLHVLGKGDKAQAVAVFVISVFLLSFLRPALAGIAFVDGFFGIFGGSQSMVANALFVAMPAALLTVVFQRNLQKFTIVLGAMTVAAVAMNVDNITGNSVETAAAKKLSPELRSVVLKEKPNIYFILADGYSSFAYMKEHGIDVSRLTDYLSGHGFRLYEEAYSNYQPTTSAMPAMLNMEHHYYSLTWHEVNFSEVSKASRTIIGGENNVSHVLKRNGYSIQYIHNGNYLLLQGCSADYCFPQIEGFAGAKIVLSNIFKMDLLSEDDKSWQTTTLGQMREQVMTLMDDASHTPRFQYIHAFIPGHAPNSMVGWCDENAEVKNYASRVARAGQYLRAQIGDIIARDPKALVLVVGDHGPFISRKCARSVYIDTLSEYRDRAGAIMAIRWSASYDGRYDDRIVSGVNLFRYVLASLAEDDTPLVQTAVPDDVFIRDGNRILKIIDNGKPLDTPPRRYTPTRDSKSRQNLPALMSANVGGDAGR